MCTGVGASSSGCITRQVSSTASCRENLSAVAAHRRAEEHLVRRRSLAALVRELHVELDACRVSSVGTPGVDDSPDSRGGVEAHHHLVRLGAVVAREEAERGAVA